MIAYLLEVGRVWKKGIIPGIRETFINGFLNPNLIPGSENQPQMVS
jgi:hypothetical protein